MHVLVTGGAGYLGTELVELLAKHPEISAITIYDNLSHGRHGLFTGKAFASKTIRFIRGELLDSRTLAKALQGIDVVVHLAAKVSTPFASGDPHSFEQVNHWGTAELSYALENSAVQKVVYASSASVYGLSEHPKTVADKPHPDTWYGTSKLRGEEMLLRLQNKMQVIVLRCANIYGYSPSLRFEAVINRFIREAFFEKRISVEGSGKQQRPFIHIRHAAEVFAHCVTDSKFSGIYNLVHENKSIMEIATVLQKMVPRLEMLFIEQDIHRNSLLVENSADLYQPSDIPSFEENLGEFVKQFRF